VLRHGLNLVQRVSTSLTPGRSHYRVAGASPSQARQVSASLHPALTVFVVKVVWEEVSARE